MNEGIIDKCYAIRFHSTVLQARVRLTLIWLALKEELRQQTLQWLLISNP